MQMLRTIALALLVGFAMPVIVQAQGTATNYDQSDRQWKLVASQITSNLEMSIDNVRTQTLRNTIIFATLYRDKVDLRRCVTALRSVYENGANATQRKLALAALTAIGSSGASNYLARHVHAAEAEEGRLVVASVLNEFFLSRARAAREAARTVTG